MFGGDSRILVCFERRLSPLIPVYVSTYSRVYPHAGAFRWRCWIAQCYTVTTVCLGLEANGITLKDDNECIASYTVVPTEATAYTPSGDVTLSHRASKGPLRHVLEALFDGHYASVSCIDLWPQIARSTSTCLVSYSVPRDW